jgi:intraflagellar transport protein 172
VDSDTISALEQLQAVAHYSTVLEQSKHQGMPTIASKVAVSLLRYIPDVPADKAFYTAGIACKDAGRMEFSMALLNRFLDVCDAIEDKSTAILENVDFEDTGIPYDLPVPPTYYLPEDRREDARSWVLTNVVDSGMSGGGLPTSQCSHCGHENYEGSLDCMQCKSHSDPCVVTGYPVSRAQRINCTSCTRPSNRDDWNKWLAKFKVCPSCENPQMPSY